jgi:hypothetical protein
VGRGKKIGLGIGAGFAVLIVLGAVGSIASNDDASTATQPPSSTSGDSASPPVTIFSEQKSVLDMMPTREDIGTEWRFNSLSYNNTSSEGYSGNSDIVPTAGGATSVGYQDGVSQDYVSEAVVKVAIFTFDSQNNAKEHYKIVTDGLYEKGGFKQIDTGSIDAECFSVFRDFDLTTVSELYCVKENVYYTVKEYGGISVYSEDVKETTLKFAKIIANKITEKLSSAQQLGSLSFTTFTEQICRGSSECPTTLALANEDISACNILTNNNTCISSYAIEFEEPENCNTATSSLDCFMTVSVSLGSSVCGLTKSESDKTECGWYYIRSAQRADHYRSEEIRQICSPTFKLSNFAVLQVACKMEQFNIIDVSTDGMVTWKTNNELTDCLSFLIDMGENQEAYCLSSLGIYLKYLSICDQAGVATAECYSFVALTEDSVDLNTCDKLGDGFSFCYMHVAYRMNDVSICEMADTNRENCIGLVNSRSG